MIARMQVGRVALGLVVMFGVAGCGLTELDPMASSFAKTKKKPSALRPTNLAPKPTEPKPPSEPVEPPPLTGEETGSLVGLRSGHNELRAAVGVAPLAWSTTLGIYAQEWANHLAANGCQLQHRSNSPYGENLYWTSTSVAASQPVAMWASESAHYDVATNTCSEGVCGHYTQMVWAATTTIGCGVASCGAQQVWVCNYDPRGNIMGQKPY